MVLAILRWMRENKLAVFFMLTTTCLLISTVALAHKNSLPSHKIKSNEHAEKQNSNYRLPPYVIPKNYKLLLDPNITSNSYNGLVIIKIQVLQPTKQINLHSKNLEIMYAGLNNGSKGNQYTTNVIKNEDLELLYIISEEEIIQGNYWIEIKFKGKLNSKAIGFYASTMKNGEIMVASKFQPTYARQAFPCFDEPEYKATYDITLVKPTNSTALSNMNQVSITSNESSKTEAVTFATSVPMSTYLACFVISDFGYKQTEIDSKGIGKNFTLRCYGQKDKLYKIDFAMDIAKKATEYYIQYYSVPYPLPKLDMIAIPDYTSGATEHWGLVTYRETSFLIDKATASVKNQIAVANTIAHELAHMWFGNLVTVKWWNDLWLNEGFATYMQTKALNAIEPSWTALDQFLVKTMHPILASDAKLSSRPIVHDVTTPDEITAIFDLVSYNKVHYVHFRKLHQLNFFLPFLCITGMKSSSQEEWDKFWKIYTEEDDPVELNRMRSGLAAPHNSDILKKYLSFAWDERNVRSQDYLSVLQHIADNPWGTELVWVDLRNRWPELVDRFTINSRYLGNAVYGITSTFNSVAKLKEMESFFKQYPEAGAGENARRQALENVRNNIEWVTANQPVVVEWLKAHV
ncbi:glutamyl aminopeptidase-like [Hyposmocoma kahamanoa]|uniref:glutamyl aminopeptidase-like n=1 Tax=Hyposmocoma kahamanoa TaxID=1477025 RepID=UPI000E6D738A|nr:glutamyl aminopeptidase-like [Hyposmocoma kahamanoa]